MEIKIRDAVPDDVEEMEHLRYKTWLATFPNAELGITVEDIEDRFKPHFTPEGIEKRRERIKEVQENGRYVVAEVDGKIVGFCLVLRYPEKNQLRSTYVLPEYQSKGIGKALWQEASKAIDPNKETFVETVTYKENTIAFYSKLGFKDTGRRFTDPKLILKSGATMPQMEMRLNVKH